MALPRGFNLLEPAHVKWLATACRERAISLIVIDTWTRSSTANPADPEAQRALMEVVTTLREDLHATIVLIDHTRKNRSDDRGVPIGGDDIFGPMQKWAAADQVIVFAGTKDGHGDLKVESRQGTTKLSLGTRCEVFIQGRDIEDGRFFLDRSQPGRGRDKFSYGGSVQPMAEARKGKATERMEEFWQAARDLGHPAKLDEIRKKILESKYGAHLVEPDTARRYANSLIALERMSRAGKGKASVYTALPQSPQDPT